MSDAPTADTDTLPAAVNTKPVRFVAIDLETTGLDPERHVILEIAAIALDADDVEISRFHATIKPPSWDVLDDADAVVIDMHSTSGLLAECHKHGVAADRAMNELRRWLAGLRAERVEILGNSPGAVDVPFLQRAWARYCGTSVWKWSAVFSHRTRDATALDQTLQEVGADPPPDERLGDHRAMSDVVACVEWWRKARADLRRRLAPPSGFTRDDSAVQVSE